MIENSFNFYKLLKNQNSIRNNEEKLILNKKSTDIEKNLNNELCKKIYFSMIQKQTNIHPIFQYIEDKGNLIKKLKNETTIEFNLKTKNNNIINYQYPEIKEELENIRNTDNEVFSLYLLYQS